MRPPNLKDIPDLWKFDGGLRDVYVLGTTLEDWERFVKFTTSYPSSYKYDGEASSLPEVAQAFEDPNHTHLLSIQVGRARLNCHFFIRDEIEIDIDPREIETSADHDSVLSFVEGLAQALGKPVIITPENEMETQIVSFEPSSHTWRWNSEWPPI